MEQAAGKLFLGRPGKMALANILSFAIPSVEGQIWLLQHGLKWENPKISLDDAIDLYEEYMESGDLDEGDKIQRFQETIGAALYASQGMDSKKALAKIDAEKNKKMLEHISIEDLRAEIDRRAGIGMTSPDSV